MRAALLFIFTFNYLSLFSQTEKGSMLLNLKGQLTHYRSFYSSLDKNYFGGIMDVEAGYAILDNLFFGVNYKPAYRFGLPGFNTFSIHEYGIYSRYYFLENKNRIYLHTDFQHAHLTTDTNQNEWNLGIGFSHFLSSNAALEAHFNYNVYNRIDLFTDPNPDDPTFFTSNNPRGLEISLRMQYFLPSQTNRLAKTERLPLQERYLLKGNRSFALEGTIYHKEFAYLGSFEKSKFIKNSLQLNHRYIGYGSYSKNVRQATIAIYLPEIEKYFSLSNHLFFAPSGGIGPSLTYFDSFHPNDFGWMATAQLAFDYFFNNSKIGAGYTIYASDGFGNYDDFNSNSNLFLSGEFFITEKLAIKPTAFYRTHGEGLTFLFFEHGRFVTVRDFRLQFGFSYYY